MLSGFPISGAPLSSTGVAQALVAAAGTFTLAGQPATTRTSYRFTAAHGSFTLAGQAATSLKGARLVASRGTFTLDGQSTAFGRGYAFAPDTGVLALVGGNAGLLAKFKVVGGAGAFALSGNAATMRIARKVIASTGAFIADGQSTAFGRGYAFSPDRGIYSLTGNAASTLLNRRISPAAYRAFAFTGQAATLQKGKRLPASTGAFTLTGQSATILYTQSQIGRHSVAPFPSPVNTQKAIDANIVRANDNLVASAFTSHDASSLIHVQSGLRALRPAVLPDGGMYVGTDTGEIYFYANGAWFTIGTAPRYGAWSDYTDQPLATANAAQLMTFNTVDFESGATLVSGSRLTAGYTGVYNLQWSGQFVSTSTQIQDVDIWARINGADVVGSTGRISIPNSHGGVSGHILPSWNYYLSLNASDYVQLYWTATSTDVSLETLPASSPHPSTASLIATMQKVG